MHAVTAFAPISSGNFIIGFDILGAAMRPVSGAPLGDFVTIRAAKSNVLRIQGPFASQLPEKVEDNIVAECVRLFYKALLRKNIAVQSVELVLDKCLPVGSGLGSSAASVVAAIKALNLFYHEPLSTLELLQLCGELEGQISGSVHYDNVAPSLLGGLQLMTQDERLSRALNAPEWFYVLLHPGTQLPTKEARAVLPKHYPLQEAVNFGQKLANFVDALHRQDTDAATKLMRDQLVEPYRAALIPKFHQAQSLALKEGALAYGISGAGPTSLAICHDLASAQEVQHALNALYQHQANAQSWICQLDTSGARPWHDTIPDYSALAKVGGY